MTRFTSTTVALLIAMLSSAHAQDLGVVTDRVRIDGDIIVRTCHTLRCFAVQSIRQQVFNGTLKEPVVLDSIEACDTLNFALFPEIKCKYGSSAAK